MRKKLPLFASFAMLISLVFCTSLIEVKAQAVISSIEITGKITADDDKSPLPGANIVVKGTMTGTTSDLDGNYKITVPNNEAILEFTFIGYTKQEILVGDQSVIDVTLSVDPAQLGEVVIVGYGTQRRENVSGSIEKVEMKDVVSTPSSNVKSLLVGQVPGLLSSQTPGLPGSDNVALSIRGFGNPLVIVDGAESSFDRLDPNDIESVSVLKDASAAIYGARAGNGVILVTTKRGKDGKPQINYHGWIGQQKSITFPELANAADYIKMGRAGVFNDQYNPADPYAEIVYPADFSQERLDLYTSGQAKSYDWPGGLLKKNGATISQHNISISGGTESIKYYTSVGTMNQNGIFKGDYYYDRITVTNNMDVKLSENLDFSLNSSYINEYKDYASTRLNDFWTDLITAQPFYNYEFPDPDRAPFSGFTMRSPVARINQNISGYNRIKTETLSAAMQMEYKTPFVEGLSFGGRVNILYRSDFQDLLNKPYDVWTYEPDSELADAQGYVLQAKNNAQASYRQSYYTGEGAPRRRMVSRLYSEYEKVFGDHSVNFLILGEQETNSFNNLYVERRNLLSYDIPQISGADDLTTIISGSTGRAQKYNRSSFAGRFNYSFKNKYLLEATLRADGSSYFGPDVRWGYFPSLSLGWNIHKESFLANSAWLTNLKLRLSYSETGIDSNVGRTTFDYLTGYSETIGSVYFLDGQAVPIITNQGLANPFITWEQTTLYNAGFDFSLLAGKIFGTVDAFYRLREGLLVVPIESFPSTFGANLPLTNLNSRSNRGFDMSLGYKGLVNGVKFTVTGNIGLAREKYESIEEDINEDDPFDVKFRKLEGKFVSETTYGYVSDGLFQTQEEVDAYLNKYTIEDINGVPAIGDVKYLDITGDGIINLEDRKQLGYGSFPELTFGLNTGFEYKNFKLNMLWQGASRFNITITQDARNPFDNEHVPFQIHVDHSFYQDPANPGVNANPDAVLPAFGRNGTHAWNNNFSDYWYKDGTYLRLKTAYISYSLPANILKSISLSNAEVYMSADNLIMFNRLGIYKNIIDPEEAAYTDGFTLPTLRTITFGIKLSIL